MDEPLARGAAEGADAPIVFSDLDGTFLTSRKTVGDLNRRALDALAAAGGSFVPCSGRPPHGHGT